MSDIELHPLLRELPEDNRENIPEFVRNNPNFGTMREFYLSLSDHPERLMAGAVLTNDLGPSLQREDFVIIDPDREVKDEDMVLVRIGDDLTLRILDGDQLVRLDGTGSLPVIDAEVMAPVIASMKNQLKRRGA